MVMNRFLPGDPVPLTGWYSANHVSHDLKADILLPEGDSFPTCPECLITPTYELVAIIHDFEPVYEGDPAN